MESGSLPRRKASIPTSGTRHPGSYVGRRAGIRKGADQGVYPGWPTTIQTRSRKRQGGQNRREPVRPEHATAPSKKGVDRDEVFELRRRGLSLRGIAKKLDLGLGTVVRTLGVCSKGS